MSATSNKKQSLPADLNKRDYAKSSFIQRKTESARSFIEKHGLPKTSKSKKGK
jgi:hypothetical protein